VNGTFNSNFYFASATVIPILYIAAIAQFPMVERIVTRLNEMTDRLTRPDPQPTGSPRPALGPNARLTALRLIRLAYIVTFLAAAFIIWASIQAEIQSIVALYRQAGANQAGVLRAVILLIVASLLVPIWTLLSVYARLFQRKGKPPDPPSP
jgi:hypothetical protein